MNMACLLSHNVTQAGGRGIFPVSSNTLCVGVGAGGGGGGGNLCLHVKLVASNVFLLFCHICPLAMLCWLSKQHCVYASSDSSALTPLPFVAPEMCKAFIKGGLFVLYSFKAQQIRPYLCRRMTNKASITFPRMFQAVSSAMIHAYSWGNLGESCHPNVWPIKPRQSMHRAHTRTHRITWCVISGKCS